MNCLVLVRRGSTPDPRLRQLLGKEVGKAKPLAWGPLEPHSHDLYAVQLPELECAIAYELAAQTGALIVLPEGPADETTITKALAAAGLKPL